MEKTWYYASNNEQKGPVAGGELLALERSGLLRADSLVWREGLASWQRWDSVAAGVRAASGAATGAMVADPAVGEAAGAEVAVCAFSGQVRPISLMVKYGDRWVALEHKEAFLQSLREGATLGRMAGVAELEPVGFWWRTLAIIIDVFVIMLPGILLSVPYLVLGFKQAMAQAGGASLDPLHQFKTMDAATIVAYVVMIAGNLLLPVVYDTWMTGRYGATVGKLAIGARVVRIGGESLTYLQSLGRAGAKLLSMMIWFMPANIAYFVGAIMSFGTGVNSGVMKEVPVAFLVGVLVSLIWYVIGPFGFYMAGWTKRKQALHDRMARTVVVRTHRP